MHHPNQRRAALDQGANHRKIRQLMHVNRIRGERSERLPRGSGSVPDAQRKAGGEGRRPGRLAIPRAGAVQKTHGMPPPTEFAGRDMRVGLRAGQRPKTFVNVKDFHRLPARFRLRQSPPDGARFMS